MLPALPAGVTESDAWMLLQLLLKASLILVLAAAAARPLRRAAARHLVWSMALGALLLLPPLALLLPVWHLPWLRLITAARPSGLASIVAVNAPLAGGIPIGAVLAAGAPPPNRCLLYTTKIPRRGLLGR